MSGRGASRRKKLDTVAELVTNRRDGPLPDQIMRGMALTISLEASKTSWWKR